MIDRANPASGAAYTAVGKYDWREMVDLVKALSEIVSAPVADLIRAFGRHLFGRLSHNYPAFLVGQVNTFDFLETVEDKIHVEVLKLYQDAELPTLEAIRLDGSRMSIGYTSCRPFGDLCIGMIEGCADFFGEEFEIQSKPAKEGLKIEINRLALQAAE